MSDAIVLQGSIAAIQLPDVLTFVSLTRRSGRLSLRREAEERTIFWNQGEIVFATSSSPEDTLSQFLLRNGKINQLQFEECERRLTSEVRAGKLLVQMGAISPKDLWWGVKNQVLEIIFALFEWQSGEFFFFDTAEDLQERIKLSISTSSIIMEGIRRLDESARIRETIPDLEMIFEVVPGAESSLPDLELNETEERLFQAIDGRKTIRELIGTQELTEFEVTQILFQLFTARLIEVAPPEKITRPVFLDVEDSPELLRVISTYNGMFGRLFASLQNSVGSEEARDIFTTALQSSDSNELWNGVFFDQDGRFDENMLIANISELPFEKRKAVLDEGLNTLLSIELFEVSQHLDAPSKVEVFRFISDQKAQLERAVG